MSKFIRVSDSGKIISEMVSQDFPESFLGKFFKMGGDAPVAIFRSDDDVSALTHWFPLPLGPAVLLKKNPSILIGNTLSEIPIPSQITVGRRIYGCDESICELDFDESGVYKIRVEATGYLSAEFNTKK